MIPGIIVDRSRDLRIKRLFGLSSPGEAGKRRGPPEALDRTSALHPELHVFLDQPEVTLTFVVRPDEAPQKRIGVRIQPMFALRHHDDWHRLLFEELDRSSLIPELGPVI